ncbi:MAG: YHS domain protein [Flavobacteriales bacterium]|nr:YHS domain protein [Flavobacteriales bacterium]
MRSLLAIILLLCTSSVALAQHKPYFNVDSKGLWVEGYDPVSYFLEGKAVEGQPSLSFTHQNATFHFATQAHLDLFKKEPTKYLPQYGGWCAYALGANNEKVEVDPETFKIRNGKLYLFYNAFFNNTLEDWNKDEARLNKQADTNWATFKHAK